MTSRGPARLLLAALLGVLPLAAQEAPLLTVLPREEQARRWEQPADLRMVQKRYLEAIDFYQQARAESPSPSPPAPASNSPGG